jgi:hypothetical protein
MKTLEQRFKIVVKELLKETPMVYSEELFQELTNGIAVGYHPSNTWENAVDQIQERIYCLTSKVA